MYFILLFIVTVHKLAFFFGLACSQSDESPLLCSYIPSPIQKLDRFSAKSSWFCYPERVPLSVVDGYTYRDKDRAALQKRWPLVFSCFLPDQQRLLPPPSSPPSLPPPRSGCWHRATNDENYLHRPCPKEYVPKTTIKPGMLTVPPV